MGETDTHIQSKYESYSFTENFYQTDGNSPNLVRNDILASKRGL